MPREEKSIPGSKHSLCKGPGAVLRRPHWFDNQ